jgi:hypothetical protein
VWILQQRVASGDVASHGKNWIRGRRKVRFHLMDLAFYSVSSIAYYQGPLTGDETEEIRHYILYAPIASTEHRDVTLEKQTDLTKTQLA